MIRTRTRGFIQSAVSATLLLAALGCSTDSPTAPRQDNSPNPPPDPRGSWGFTIEVEPPEVVYCPPDDCPWGTTYTSTSVDIPTNEPVEIVKHYAVNERMQRQVMIAARRSLELLNLALLTATGIRPEGR